MPSTHREDSSISSADLPTSRAGPSSDDPRPQREWLFERTEEEWLEVRKAEREWIRKRCPNYERPPGAREGYLESKGFLQLMVEARFGSREALETLIVEWSERLLRAVRRRRAELGIDEPNIHSGWRTSCVVESIEGAMSKLDQFRGRTEGEFFCWLWTIFEHYRADRVRAYHALKHEPAREVCWYSMTPEQREEAERCQDPSPDERAVEAETDAALAAAVDGLDEPARQAVRLRYWEGWSYKQIAEKLGKSAKAVDGILRRAQQQLRALLRPQMDEEPEPFERDERRRAP